MSTRSFIARQNKNGSIDFVYCHWDGYLSYNGFLLFTNYHNVEKVNQLFEKKIRFLVFVLECFGNRICKRPPNANRR